MRVKLIAEIGLNANGDMAIAKKLMDYCRLFGVDYVKFQKRNPDICVPNDQKGLMRDTPWGRMTYLEYRRKVEFSIPQYTEIDVYAKATGMKWFPSVWDEDSLHAMESFSPPFIKIPSACLTDVHLLSSAKATGIPIILSTGMSDFPMISKAMDILGNSVAYLLHCTSTYPCPVEEQNLACIATMKAWYPRTRIGYSNHHTGVPGMIAAMALGAEIIEFHITLDRSMWGTDQSSSMEPELIWKICKYRDYMEKAMGNGIKTIYDSEQPIMQKLRRVG